MYALLPTGLCSVERVAQHLSVDRRTVHRRLEQAHTTYSDILAEARADLVFRYLENRERPLRLRKPAGGLGAAVPSVPAQSGGRAHSVSGDRDYAV